MMFADTGIDWPALLSAVTAFLVVLTALLQRRLGRTVTAAASAASQAAVTAKAQAAQTTREVQAVHDTLNGAGILGVLRAIRAWQDAHAEAVRGWQAAHADEDRGHFARIDKKLDGAIDEVKNMATAVNRGIVIPPGADPSGR